MRKIVYVIISLFITTHIFGAVERYRKGNLVIENIPSEPFDLGQRLKLYQNVRGAAIRDWLPGDEGVLITTRFGNTYQLHVVKTPGGLRRQITFFEEPVFGGIVCPDIQVPFFLFNKDSAGNELYQIYKYNLETGENQLLTDGESKCGAVKWSNKGNRFSFSSNTRNGKDYDLYIGTLKGYDSFQRVLEKGGYWYAVDWSPDDKQLLVKQFISAKESYYYIFDINSRELIKINPVEQKISYGGAYWAKDGKGIYMVSDQFGDFLQLLYYDSKLKKFDILTEQISWDVEDFELSPSGDTIVFVTNEDGINKLYFLDAETQVINQVRLPLGLIYNLKFKPDGLQLGFVINTSRTPSDIYSLNLKNKTLIRWTYSEVGGIDTSTFVQPQLIHYETFDSVDAMPRSIPAYYYKPNKFKPPYPVLIECHGGPESQFVPGFSSLTQFFLNEMGIAFIAPNIRGSTGYGKDYHMLDDGYKRENAVRDIGALLDWIEAQPELDADHIGIMGGSYGGYIVLASMIHYSDRLRCGIDEWGISSFISFLENTGAYRQDLRRVEYGDERDPEMREFLQGISPLASAHKITKPMFIVQGLNDPRVPVSEAEQIVKAVRQNGIEVWYLLAEDEGHGFGKKSNRDFYREALIRFLEKFLLK